MKNLYRIWFLTVILVFSLCLLTACGGSDTDEKAGSGSPFAAADAGDTLDPLDIVGTAWEVDGTAYHFYEDGTAIIGGEYLGEYTWDGLAGTITLDGSTAELMYDEDGFFIEGEDGYYYQLAYSGDADSSLYAADDGGAGAVSGGLDITDTSWEFDGVLFRFYDDGTVAVVSVFGESQEFGAYSWDGASGQLATNSSVMNMEANGDVLYIQGENGSFYPVNYYGAADAPLPDESYYEEQYGGEEEDDEDIDAPYGAYDNDEVKVSILFNSDGTCVVSTLDAAVDGIYTVDAGGYLYIENDNGDLGGWYDAENDTFTMDGTDGYFYYVGFSSGYYVP